MAIYKGARAVIQSGAQLGTSQKFADASARKAQDVRRSRESAATAKERVGAVEETLQGAGVRGDDGVPPGYPTVTAQTFFHQVDLYWPRPPASDEVAGSLVRIRPENEASRIVSRPAHGSPATIKNLPHKPHTFEVLLFDKWGRESLWSDPVTATPMLTAAEEIDLSEIAVLGRLRGLLPDTNLATITDATKLADELVSSGKIAPGAVTAPKILSDSVQTRHITAGAVTADVMAAQNAAAFNLWAQNAMIRSAAIQSITADKIAAGTMTAGQITLAGGGSVKAGETTLDAKGIKIPALANPGNALFDSEYQKYTIADTNDKAKLYFNRPRDAGSAFSAILQGEAGNQARGMVFVGGVAEPSDWDHPANALLRVASYRPSDANPSFFFGKGADVQLQGRWSNVIQATDGYSMLHAINDNAVVWSATHKVRLTATNGVIDCEGPLKPWFIGGGTDIAPNSWAQWTHGFGRKPDLVMGWRDTEGAGDWQPLPTPSGYLYVQWADPAAVRVANAGPTRSRVGVVCY